VKPGWKYLKASLRDVVFEMMGESPGSSIGIPLCEIYIQCIDYLDNYTYILLWQVIINFKGKKGNKLILGV
jgi:hypothetical protein